MGRPLDRPRLLPAPARRRVALALAGAALLAGCASGPDFKPPEGPSSPGYTASALADRTVSADVALGAAQRIDPEAGPDGQWWRTLGSPQLDALVEQAHRASPTLAAARASLAQARELQAARAGSTRYPQLEAGFATQRQQAMPVAGASAVAQVSGSSIASLGARYAFDLAGGNRRALEALAARTDYRSYQLEAAKLTLTGSIVQAAVTIAALSEQIRSTQAMVGAQEEQVQIAGERMRLGHAAPNEQLALQVQLESTRADLHLLHRDRQHHEHLLAVLSGTEPGQGSLPAFTLDDFVLPQSLPLVLPSQLARRRPDIRAAESLLRAANAEYGVAVASLYPQLSLSASFGSQAVTAASLFGGGSAVWSMGAQLAQPLFRPGLAAEKRAALAAFDAAAANYQSVVLEALRTVADVLRSVEQDARVLASRSAAERAAQASLRLAQQRYVLGAGSYLEVLDALRQLQQSRTALAAAQARRLQDTAALHVALGGASLREVEAGIAVDSR